ncbi:phosphomannomutase/phosphoglucomutase [Candidatus Micrarchaeota archaeon]|nr:phosphomannomutase/phosphoglucomutase [Candidatus Micrarchaeota archaeon]
MSLEGIFREYDVRGFVGAELNEEVYCKLGRAFAAYVEGRAKAKPSCVVGRDNRPSSEAYAKAFIEGFADGGGEVIDVGLATTPAAYFANNFFKTKAGAAITASHNPPEYNGAKFVFGGRSAGGAEVQKVKKLFFSELPKKAGGKVTKQDFTKAYFADLAKNSRVRKLKVVVDCGNGAASAFAPAFLESLGCEVVPLHCDSSKPFSVHLPDPVDPENYGELVAAVRQSNADLGLMFDGDGDRLGAVDESGRIVWPDQLLILFARKLLAEKPASKVIVEIKCSQAVFDDVRARGGKPVLSPTGRTRVEEIMASEKAPLAGEMSGHFFFAPSWLSDAFFASRKLLEIVSEVPLSEALEGAPKYFSSQEYRVAVEEEKKFWIVESLSKEFPENEVVTMDGVKVLFADGWGLVRASQNEPKLSIRFEGRTKETLARIQKLFRSKLEAKGVKVPF